MDEQLTADQIDAGLAELGGWTAADGALHRSYDFDGYRPAVAFAVRVAFEAEAANHHPDLLLTWGRVDVTLTTHSAGGITQKDLDLAGTIEGLSG
jgi:4a-hydroxytetrahydrobiopterin dehydratase